MTAREIVLGLPKRFNAAKAGDFDSIVHLNLEGDGGGIFTVKINDGNCSVTEAADGIPDCVVRTKASTYVDTEIGKSNPTMAVMMGKIKVSNIGVLSHFIQFFDRLN